MNSQFQTEFVASLNLSEGLNRIFIQCTDQEDNTMPGFFIIEYTYDTTGPTKVSEFMNDGNKILWSASTDDSGIDHYVIYNSLKSVATTYQTYWTATTNDSIYFISAIDKAGNEGEKTEYNLGRIELLGSEFEVKNESNQNVAVEIVEQNITGREGISTTAKIAWISFGILLLIYFAWKAYEHKQDPHGLRHYIRNRRRMRDVEIHRK
jgi:hypothetical protein